MKIVAPQGAAVHAAIIGAEDLDRSLAFYRDIIGMEIVDEGRMEGFQRFWHVPDSVGARYAALADRGADVGRVILIEFDAPDRRLVRDIPDESAVGLMNVNFYCEDMATKIKAIEAAGYEAWSEPMRHVMAPHVGSPIEVMFDGPDTVIINLVELATSDPATRIGQMRAYVKEEFGYNANGFTPVVTTQHAVSDTAKAVEFYRKACGMEMLFDDVVSSPGQNRFSRYPEGSSTRTTFMQGNHMFGKVAVNEALDYPVISMTETAVAPNIGYLAQAFRVPSLDAALKGAGDAGASLYSERTRTIVPGLGEVEAAIVRNPGSGALMLLIEE